jgi:hypothetical protein
MRKARLDSGRKGSVNLFTIISFLSSCSAADDQERGSLQGFTSWHSSLSISISLEDIGESSTQHLEENSYAFS